MKRYIDFENEDWPDRTEGRMQAARWEACMEGLGDWPPRAGVLDAAGVDLLSDLIDEGWVSVEPAVSEKKLRRNARNAVMASLADDLDCLSAQEHTLVERMLIGEGLVYLDTVPEMEAAYTLRMRLWCDIGMHDREPCARLDKELAQALPALLMSPRHAQRRSRLYVYDGMIHGLLYLGGYLDHRLPIQRFIEEVLQDVKSPQTLRLARNYLEASFDLCVIGGCTLLLHPAMAATEALNDVLRRQGALYQPSVTTGQLMGSMNELLPEEMPVDQKLQLALAGALRPEYEPQEAAADLRLLIKQGAPFSQLRDVMAGMLCVLPTPHMENTLLEMSCLTPRWITGDRTPPPVPGGGLPGMLH